jgi:hypothetical protein
MTHSESQLCDTLVGGDWSVRLGAGRLQQRNPTHLHESVGAGRQAGSSPVALDCMIGLDGPCETVIRHAPKRLLQTVATLRGCERSTVD